MLDAQPPSRFSTKFLENLGFDTTNDRLFIGILKELGFLNADSAPQQRYFDFMDRSRSKQVLAESVRQTYSDLYAVNKEAHELKANEIKNKLRTLYTGKKTDLVIDRISKTFSALCEYADFTKTKKKEIKPGKKGPAQIPASLEAEPSAGEKKIIPSAISLDSLQYHINIVLPESRDQAVYDAIFKSLRDHLGREYE
jgi:hypothetical protein